VGDHPHGPICHRKTTQIPQFLIESDPTAKVVVCQPRRLAAVGVAARVAWEQSCSIGEVCLARTNYLIHSMVVGGPFGQKIQQDVEQDSSSILYLRNSFEATAVRQTVGWNRLHRPR
jgi:hypothetical protein